MKLCLEGFARNNSLTSDPQCHPLNGQSVWNMDVKELSRLFNDGKQRHGQLLHNFLRQKEFDEVQIAPETGVYSNISRS